MGGSTGFIIGGINYFVYNQFLMWKYNKYLEIENEKIIGKKVENKRKLNVENAIKYIGGLKPPDWMSEFFLYLILTPRNYERFYQLEKEKERIEKKEKERKEKEEKVKEN